MKYQVLDPNLTAISRGDFCARVENGLVDLPEDVAQDFLAVGMIAIAAVPDIEYQETADDGLREPERRQTRARKQRND